MPTVEELRQQLVADRMRRALTDTYTSPVPGMEQLGALPIPSPPKLPAGLAPPPVRSVDVRGMMGNYGAPPTKEQAQQAVESLQSYGNLMPEGTAEIGAGVYDFPTQKLHGLGEIARGTMKVGTPALGAAMATPLAVAEGLAVGTGVGWGSSKAAAALGAKPEAAQDIGDILGLASGMLTGLSGMVRRFGAARAAADMNRMAETVMAKIPEATPEQAAQLRAQAAALTHDANALSPPTVAPVAPPPKPKEAAPPPAGILEPSIAEAQKAQLSAQRTEAPTIEAPTAPEAPAPPPTSPLPAEVERTRLGQLVETGRTTRQTQRAAGIAPDVTPDPLSSEAGVLSLPTPQEISAGRQWFKTRFFDEFTPLQELAKRGTLTLEEDPYIAARMYAGHYGKIWEGHRQLREIAMPVAKQKLLPEFNSLLELNRDVELFNRPDLEYRSPRAKDLNDAQQKLQELRYQMTPEQRTFLDTKTQEFYRFHKELLDDYADSGMISPDALDAIRANNEFYAPFHRLSHLDDKALEQIPQGGRTLIVRKQGVVYPIIGSETATAPVLESTLRNLHRMVSTAEKNRVGRALADLSERPEWEKVVRPLAKGEEPGPGEKAISVFEEGVKNQYAVPETVADSMQGVSVRQVSKLQKVLDFTNAGVRSGATMYYMPFLVKNAIRDYRTALLRSPVGFTPADWLYGFAQSVRRGPEFAEYMRSRAAQSGFFERDVKLSKEVAHITETPTRQVLRHLNPLAAARLLSETIELAPRVGIFRRAMDAGLGETQAAWMARNVTQDFSSIGTWMRTWNSMTPFVNARLHGAVNVLAAVRDNPQRAGMVIGFGTLLPTLYLHYHNRLMYPEVLSKIPQSTLDSNYVFIYGSDKDQDGKFTKVFKFPKMDSDRYFGNPVENFLNWQYNTHPKSWWQTAGEFLSDFSPVGFMRNGRLSPGKAAVEGLPPAVTTGGELINNSDWYSGFPIESQGVQEGSAGQRWGTTPDSLKLEQTAIGRRLIDLSNLTGGLSPLQYRHLLRRFGAGAGRLLTQPSEEDTATSQTAEIFGKEAVVSMFKGAPSSGEEDRLQREMEPSIQQAADDRIVRERNVLRVLVAAKKKPEEDQLEVVFDAWEHGKLNDRELEDSLQKMESEKFGLTPGQMAISNLPNHAKALYLLSMEARLPEKEYDDLQDKFLSVPGWITDGVLEDIEMTRFERMQKDMGPEPSTAPSTTKPLIPAKKPVRGPTVADRNNNPLNLRSPAGPFFQFETPEKGWEAGKADIRAKMEGRSKFINPKEPLSKFFEVWAPDKDPANSPTAYTEYVAARLGVAQTTPIKNLSGRIDDLVQAMSEFEGWNGPPVAAVQSAGTVADAIRRALSGGR